jgi:hypothetical protein
MKWQAHINANVADAVNGPPTRALWGEKFKLRHYPVQGRFARLGQLG